MPKSINDYYPNLGEYPVETPLEIIYSNNKPQEEESQKSDKDEKEKEGEKA